MKTHNFRGELADISAKATGYDPARIWTSLSSWYTLMVEVQSLNCIWRQTASITN